MLDIIYNKVETEVNSICAWNLKMSTVLLLLSLPAVCVCGCVCVCARARVHVRGRGGGRGAKREIVGLVRG